MMFITNIMTLKFGNLSLKSKYSFLANFSNDLDKFSRLKPKKEKTKEKKNKRVIHFQNYIMAC